MPDFDRINPQLEEMKGKIKLAEEEMLFVQGTFHSLNLKIKPVWVICILISLFVMEAIKAVLNKGFDISIWTYVVTALIAVGYLVYFIIESVNNSKYNKERRDLFAMKRSVYENLNNNRREFFEDFVRESGGEKLVESNLNLIRYIWKDGELITLATLKEDLEVITINESEVRYIANDELLSDYNKSLGLSVELESSTPYCYLFTEDRCYVFLSDCYSVLKKLFPDKEIERAILSEATKDESEVI